MCRGGRLPAVDRAWRRRGRWAPSPVRMSAPALLIQASMRPSDAGGAGRGWRALLRALTGGQIQPKNRGAPASGRDLAGGLSRPLLVVRIGQGDVRAGTCAATAMARPMPLDPPVTSTTRPPSVNEMGEARGEGRAEPVSYWRMRLLVSVSGAADAAAALEGGADIIDAKDATQGALGAVAPAMLDAIIAATGGRSPVSAALGEAPDSSVPIRVAALRPGEVSFVKLGFAAGVQPPSGADVRAFAGRCSCRYRDGDGARGVCRCRARPPGPQCSPRDRHGLRRRRQSCWTPSTNATAARCSRWPAGGRSGMGRGRPRRAAVCRARRIDRCGRDRAGTRHRRRHRGVRGAACDGGRTGHVSPMRVRALAAEMRRVGGEPAPAPAGRATLG